MPVFAYHGYWSAVARDVFHEVNARVQPEVCKLVEPRLKGLTDAAVNYVGILELAKTGVFSEGHRYSAYVGSCVVVGGEGVVIVSWVPGVADGVRVEPWFEKGGLFQKGVYEEVKHVYVDDVMTTRVPSAARVASVFVSLVLGSSCKCGFLLLSFASPSYAFGVLWGVWEGRRSEGL